MSLAKQFQKKNLHCPLLDCWKLFSPFLLVQSNTFCKRRMLSSLNLSFTMKGFLASVRQVLGCKRIGYRAIASSGKCYEIYRYIFGKKNLKVWIKLSLGSDFWLTRLRPLVHTCVFNRKTYGLFTICRIVVV